MSYGQYARGPEPPSRAAGHFLDRGDDHTGGHNSTQTDSFHSFASHLSSVKKHKRRMGTGGTARLPQRLSKSESGFGRKLISGVDTGPASALEGEDLAGDGLSSAIQEVAEEEEQAAARSRSSSFRESAGESGVSADGRFVTVRGKRYSISRQIGKGGSSVVYSVQDEERNEFAIKEVDLSSGEIGAAEREGFIKEVETLKMLQTVRGSDKIIKCYDDEIVRARSGRECLYVVMERGDRDLAGVLKDLKESSSKERGGRGGAVMDEVDRKFYWKGMLKAVQAIHEANVVHSDLKPANFMLVGAKLKLIDFGIASRIQSDQTHVMKENMHGTLNYISPEALDERPKIKTNSDVWSLGCILYHMTYGKLPFAHIRDMWAKLTAIKDPNYKIRIEEDGYDPNLVDTIRKCLVHDPYGRASVAELLAHPYLSESQARSSGLSSSNSHLLPSQLLQQLTPNTMQGVKRAMQRLNGTTKKTLDFE